MQNVQVEINALAYLMQTRKPELLVSISSEHFGNGELAKVFLLIKRFYLEHGEFQGWDVLRAQVSRACKKADTAKFMLSILDQAQNRDITGLTDDILLQELQDYYKFRLVLSKVEPLVQAVELKDIDETLARLKELHDSVFTHSGAELEDADISVAVTKGRTKFRFRKTGIKPIDERGGLIVGGYTLIAAYAKTGKSTVLTMIALYQYLYEEGSVAIFSYEMGHQEVYARVICNFADIDLGDYLADRLAETDRRKLLAAEAEFFCGLSLELTEFIAKNCHLQREEFLKLLFQTFPKRKNKFYIFDERIDYLNLLVKMKLLAEQGVKLFGVDYPWLVPRGKAFPGVQSWEYNLEVSKSWKTFAHETESNVITPAQLDPGKKGEDPKLKFVTNAINDTDLTLYMTRNEEDKILDTTTFTFAAMRNFISVPGTSFPAAFKMQNELNKARFSHMEF